MEILERYNYRQVDQVPRIVDQEVVDEPRLAGCPRDLCQPLPAGQHVDERRLADVAAPDEGDVLQRILRNLRDALRAATAPAPMIKTSVLYFILFLPVDSHGSYNIDSAAGGVF